MSTSELIKIGVLKSRIPSSLSKRREILDCYNNPPYSTLYLSYFSSKGIKELARVSELEIDSSLLKKDIIDLLCLQDTLIISKHSLPKYKRLGATVIKQCKPSSQAKYNRVIAFYNVNVENVLVYLNKDGLFFSKKKCENEVLEYQEFKEFMNERFYVYERITSNEVIKKNSLPKVHVPKPKIPYNKVPILLKRSEKISLHSTSITTEEFRSLLSSIDFLSTMELSQKNLFKEKIVRYETMVHDMEQEKKDIEIKIQVLKNKGANQWDVKETYPMYAFYTSFILDIKHVIVNLKKRIAEMNIDRIKADLLSILDDKVCGFASIIGRDNVKNQLVAQIYAFSNCYSLVLDSFFNTALLGKPGAGKTALAKVMAFAYLKSGILATDVLKIVSRSDLVGRWIGSTAQRTRSILLQTLEGVLFIDEAYQLFVRSNSYADYGPESITEIVNFASKYPGLSVIILAGYEDKMKDFFSSNAGLERRFPNKIILSSYTSEQLTDIFLMHFNQKTKIIFSPEEQDYIFSVIDTLVKDSVFENQAGDIINLVFVLSKSIHSSFSIKWGESPKTNLELINEGLNEYIQGYGYFLS